MKKMYSTLAPAERLQIGRDNRRQGLPKHHENDSSIIATPDGSLMKVKRSIVSEVEQHSAQCSTNT
jgi:hypothetical protein